MSARIVQCIVLLLLAAVAPIVSGCSCAYMEANTVANNLKSYGATIKVWIGSQVSSSGSMYADKYFGAYVDAIFNGGQGRGRLVVRDRGLCGANIQTHTDMLLFGHLEELDNVEGYFGSVSVFTPAPCASNQDWNSVSADDKSVLWSFDPNTR